MISDKVVKTRLVALADALGYMVIFRRVRAMHKDDLGLTCPDINRIYIDPRGEGRISTLAHEIAHAILFSMSVPGHRDGSDTEFDDYIAETAADEIATALCRALGHSHDFAHVGETTLQRLIDARKKYGDTESWRLFAQGYLLALADVLPSSEIGLDAAIEMVQKDQKTGKRDAK